MNLRQASTTTGLALDSTETAQTQPWHSTRGDRAAFFRAWIQAPLRTGAHTPSTHRLAEAMVFAAAVRPGLKVVELGPGTGIVTAHLIAAGVAEQDLILVEANPAFCKLLRARYKKAEIIEGDAFDAVSRLAKNQLSGVGAVVSSLPLFVYPREKRVLLLDHALSLVGRSGRVVQFTYGVISPFPRSERSSARASRRVWRNLYPAVVWSYSAARPEAKGRTRRA